eukprot:gene14480-21702_t
MDVDLLSEREAVREGVADSVVLSVWLREALEVNWCVRVSDDVP